MLFKIIMKGAYCDNSYHKDGPLYDYFPYIVFVKHIAEN